MISQPTVELHRYPDQPSISILTLKPSCDSFRRGEFKDDFSCRFDAMLIMEDMEKIDSYLKSKIYIRQGAGGRELCKKRAKRDAENNPGDSY